MLDINDSKDYVTFNTLLLDDKTWTCFFSILSSMFVILWLMNFLLFYTVIIGYCFSKLADSYNLLHVFIYRVESFNRTFQFAV